MSNNDNNTNENLNLERYYKELMNFAKIKNIPLSLSLETFEKEYEKGNYEDPKQYLAVYYNLLQADEYDRTLETGLKKKWYYNTGLFLSQKPTYEKYNLLSNLQVGDIIFEAKGGFGITAHIAIVEGIFYNETFDTKFVRVIEAIGDGVVRSVLDDERFVDKDVSVLRIKNKGINITKVLDFCISQLGKNYSLDFQKNTSPDEDDWYCSELVWAAYKSVGLDIETTDTFNEPGITPRDINNSNELYPVDLSKAVISESNKSNSKFKTKLFFNDENTEEKKAFFIFALGIIILVLLASLEPYFKKRR